VTRNRTQASSPTWKQDVRRGITVTSTVARQRFCVPTAPSSRKQCLFVTGGSTSDATSAQLYMQSTVGFTGHPKKTPQDHTDSLQKNFYKTYSCERVHSNTLFNSTVIQVETHVISSKETAILKIRLHKVKINIEYNLRFIVLKTLADRLYTDKEY
jgi:hypothetical protein